MATSQLLEAVESISTNLDAFKKNEGARVDALQNRIEEIESKGDRPRMGGGDFSAEQNEYKSVFCDWVRHSKDPVYASRLAEAQHELGKKNVTIGTGSAGGFALPEEISRRIENRERQLDPFRGIVRVERCSTNDYKALISMGDGTSAWSAETGTRNATTSPTLRERAPTFGEQYALPTASEWSLDDVFFNVEDWLVNEIAADWAAAEATAIISGSGSNQLTGILNTTPVVTNDDGTGVSPEALRDAATIEYVGLSGSSSPASLDLDSVINLVSQVKERYLMEADACAFVMHRLTAATLRKLKDDNGHYLWQESAQLGQPATLLGYKVLTCDAMPLATSTLFPVLFGNFRRGYLLVDRVGIRVTPNPYSVPGLVSFYARRRLGGCVLNNDAIKALRIEA